MSDLALFVCAFRFLLSFPLSLLSSSVVDVHKGWCGPCDVMAPTYERAYVDYDEFETRARFLSVCAALQVLYQAFCKALLSQVSEDVLTKEQRDSLPLQDGCKPLFVFYKVVSRTRCVVCFPDVK